MTEIFYIGVMHQIWTLRKSEDMAPIEENSIIQRVNFKFSAEILNKINDGLLEIHPNKELKEFYDQRELYKFM